jgi:coenzyme F420 hydrogenase subunit beta
VGHAANEEVRQRGGSGGLVTQLLLYLSRRKEIQGAVVVRADPDYPWKGKPWTARSEAEILESAKSKYCIVPLNQILGKIKREKGPFALVGLPCHIHALRKWAAIDRRWETRIPLVIGLFCHMCLEEEAPQDLKRISPTEVNGFEYRGGEWPGVMRVHLKSGEVRNLHHPDVRGYIFTYLSYLYYPRRCLYCLDASSELADLSVADPWLRDAKGNWKYPGGWSMVIARTGAGLELLRRASKDGAIVLEQLSPSYLRRAHDPMVALKKRDNLFRLEKLARKGQPYPDYHLQFPLLSQRERRKAWRSCLPSILGKYRLIRRAAARIIFSPLGTPLTELWIYLKKRRQRCL